MFPGELTFYVAKEIHIQVSMAIIRFMAVDLARM